MLFAGLCAALFLPRCLPAQATPSSEASGKDSTPVFHISSEFTMLDAMVQNKKTGALLGGLKAGDFQLSEDGVSQTITYFSQDELPLSVVFLFDLTDTVQPRLKPLAAGAMQVLGHLKPQDEVAIMTFSSSTQLLQGFITDHALAAAAVARASGMKSGQGTFIHEDMYEAVQQAMKSTVPGSRRVLVWFTDGTSNLENALTQKLIGRDAPAHLHTKQEATDTLLRSGVVVSELLDKSALTNAMVAASDLSPFGAIMGARTGDIRRYADETGGPVLSTNNQQTAERLGELIDEIRERYTLGYKPSTSKPPGTFCAIKLELKPSAYARYSDVARKSIMVRTERGYYR